MEITHSSYSCKKTRVLACKLCNHNCPFWPAFFFCTIWTVWAGAAHNKCAPGPSSDTPIPGVSASVRHQCLALGAARLATQPGDEKAQSEWVGTCPMAYSGLHKLTPMRLSTGRLGRLPSLRHVSFTHISVHQTFPTSCVREVPKSENK